MYYQILIFLFATKTALVNCNFEARTLGFEKNRFKIERIGKMDPVINEGSGICKSPWSNNLLTINDSGGKPEIYEVDYSGNLIATHKVPDAKNVDWEEITADNKGNVYIGDFGNNKSKRKDLTIYKYKDGRTEKIKFRFADQNFNEQTFSEYDCEAFFWKDDSLFIFTKSWERGKKQSRMYICPDQPGEYELYPQDEITIKAQITGAGINPSETNYALISYGKIFIFNINDNVINMQSPKWCIKIARSQTEAIMFENDSTLIFTNEQRKIYKMSFD